MISKDQSSLSARLMWKRGTYLFWHDRFILEVLLEQFLFLQTQDLQYVCHTPGLSWTMGMSRFRASASSPMSALRSTPAEESNTTRGRTSRYAWMPPSICSRGTALSQLEIIKNCYSSLSDAARQAGKDTIEQVHIYNAK